MLLDVNVLLALAWPNHQFHEVPVITRNPDDFGGREGIVRHVPKSSVVIEVAASTIATLRGQASSHASSV